jgi:squalene-hopene/tetraprenyl-beta-curcumene cyclase
MGFEFSMTALDVDDSGIVMMAIKNARVNDCRAKEAIERGINWCSVCRAKTEGGAPLTKTTPYVLNKILLPIWSLTILRPRIHRKDARIDGTFGTRKSLQQYEVSLHKEDPGTEGPWWGRWVSIILAHLVCLERPDGYREDMSQQYIRKAVNWLKLKQNPDGGWENP